MARLEILIALALAVFLVLVILQNTDSVETHLLFTTVSMPRAALLSFAVLLGFILGLLTSFMVARRGK